MCTIKEKWESSSSNYQHTKSNILWEDWELSFCKLSVLIWAEDATRVCLVFRVALCGEKFSNVVYFLNYWRVAWRNDAWSSFLLPWLHTDTIFLSPIREFDSWYGSNTIQPDAPCITYLLTLTTWPKLKPQSFLAFSAEQPCLTMISWMVVCSLWSGLVSPVGSSQWPCGVILVSRANLPSQCAVSRAGGGGTMQMVHHR